VAHDHLRAVRQAERGAASGARLGAPEVEVERVRDRAEKYITGLFAAFDKIAAHGVVSKPIPAEFGVEGFFFRYERHFVYCRHLSNGDTGLVTILHERMHQIDRFRDDFGPS